MQTINWLFTFALLYSVQAFPVHNGIVPEDALVASWDNSADEMATGSGGGPTHEVMHANNNNDQAGATIANSNGNSQAGGPVITAGGTHDPAGGPVITAGGTHDPDPLPRIDSVVPATTPDPLPNIDSVVPATTPAPTAPPTSSVWYCVIKNGVVISTTDDLSTAQSELGYCSIKYRGAIIPMSGSEVEAGGLTSKLTSLGGDPHDLDKTWNGGSMWWMDWWQINDWRKICAQTSGPGA